jgi:hypothetical protein
MERWIITAALGILAAVGTACSKTDSAATVDGHKEHSADVGRLSAGYGSDQAPPARNKADAPDKVVLQFLEAARSGDQRKLSQLMTEKARKETTDQNINFELESYQNATFEVGEVEYLTPEKNTSHVGCKWTDHDGDASFSHDVIWVMRSEEPGWRVVGMITRPFPDQPPVAFDYENVKELMNTKAMIEQEVKRRAEEEEKEARRAAHRESSAK